MVQIFGDREERAARNEIKSQISQLETAIRNTDIDISEKSNEFDAAYAEEISRTSSEWHYLILDDIDSDALNHKGREGWDLVNFCSYTTGFGLGGNERMKVHMRYVFKRSALTDWSQDLRNLSENLLSFQNYRAEIYEQILILKAELN